MKTKRIKVNQTFRLSQGSVYNPSKIPKHKEFAKCISSIYTSFFCLIVTVCKDPCLKDPRK